MADQNSIDRNAVKYQPLTSEGLLEQLNLPRAATRFIRWHQRLIWLVVGAVALVICAGAGFSTWREYREEQAASALDDALVAKQDNRALLEQVEQTYGSTSSGIWARIELALLAEKEGKRPQAINRLMEINEKLATNSSLKPLVLTKLGYLCESEKQFDQAVAFNTELVALGDHFAAGAYHSLGRLNEQLGKKEEAAAMYTKYLELTAIQMGATASNPMRAMVQSRLNLLKK
jgi:Uncharacterized protein conserved in bacteria